MICLSTRCVRGDAWAGTPGLGGIRGLIIGGGPPIPVTGVVHTWTSNQTVNSQRVSAPTREQRSTLPADRESAEHVGGACELFLVPLVRRCELVGQLNYSVERSEFKEEPGCCLERDMTVLSAHAIIERNKHAVRPFCADRASCPEVSGLLDSACSQIGAVTISPAMIAPAMTVATRAPRVLWASSSAKPISASAAGWRKCCSQR